ncbi:MAG: hypothetical protein WD770_05000 [Actinomycetota bacterium]
MTAPEVGSPAPDPVLVEGDGSEVQLSRFWKDRPALVVFLRHWG